MGANKRKITTKKMEDPSPIPSKKSRQGAASHQSQAGSAKVIFELSSPMLGSHESKVVQNTISSSVQSPPQIVVTTPMEVDDPKPSPGPLAGLQQASQGQIRDAFHTLSDQDVELDQILQDAARPSAENLEDSEMEYKTTPTEQKRSGHSANEITCAELFSLLEEAVGPSFHAPARKYNKGFVLLLTWQADDMGSINDLNQLGSVFQEQFGFTIQTYAIPISKSKMHLQQTLSNFLQAYDSADSLLVVCYAGHSSVRSVTNGAHKSILFASQDAVGLEVLDLHKVLLSAEPESSILYLMDCYQDSITPSATGSNLIEALWAGVFAPNQPSANNNAFIRHIIAELKSLAANKVTFNVAQLHAKLGESFLKSSNDTMLLRPCYSSFGPVGSNAIVLEPRQTDVIEVSHSLHLPHTIESSWLTPLIHFNIRIVENPILSHEAWMKWCTTADAKEAMSVLGLTTLRVRDLVTLEGLHAGNVSNSSILTISIPEFMFRKLPKLPSINYMMFVKSPNLLPTPGSLALRTPSPGFVDDDMLVLSENRFNTITPFNWWAIEEKYDTPDEMKSGKLGEILGFAERKTCHAIFLVDVGKWHEAEQLCRDVITRMEKDKVWKDMDCPYALNGTKNLALVYKHQEKLGESAILFKQLLSRCLEQYGKDHHWTLNSAHHLGVLHKNLGQLEEAANIQSLVMTSRKASHGEFDLLMLTSMHQLALVYRAQDRDNEAEDLHKEVINSLSAAYGECHSLVIAATKGLAMILRKQGRDLEAELVETSARRLSRSTAVT